MGLSTRISDRREQKYSNCDVSSHDATLELTMIKLLMKVHDLRTEGAVLRYPRDSL
jgi:hypothetical protein